MFSSNIYCFSGNPYLIREKIRSWKESFRRKHGNELNIIDVRYEKSDDGDAVIREIESFPFLSPYKLVFVYHLLDGPKGVPHDGEDLSSSVYKKIEQACFNVPDKTIVVFVSSNPDRRRSLFKNILSENVKTFRLTKHLMIEGFDDGGKHLPLSEFFLHQFHRAIDKESMDYLISLLVSQREEEGIDLFLLHHETEKVLSYCSGRNVTRDDIDQVVSRVFGKKIFAFTDALGAGNTKEAINILTQLLSSGEDILAIFWRLLVPHFRSLIVVRAFLDEGRTMEQIRAYLGPVAFKAQDLIRQAKEFSPQELKEMYALLLDIDIRQKTGGITLSATNVTSLQLAMERFIFLVSSQKS